MRQPLFTIKSTRDELTITVFNALSEVGYAKHCEQQEKDDHLKSCDQCQIIFATVDEAHTKCNWCEACDSQLCSDCIEKGAKCNCEDSKLTPAQATPIETTPKEMLETLDASLRRSRVRMYEIEPLCIEPEDITMSQEPEETNCYGVYARDWDEGLAHHLGDFRTQWAAARALADMLVMMAKEPQS